MQSDTAVGNKITFSKTDTCNLAFIFWLLESCKLNKVNFGEYIEDILTRILYCEDVDSSFLPCDYVRHFEDGTDAKVTKTSQAVA